MQIKQLAEEKLLFAEFFDGVAEFGGFLEFELLGRLLNFGFEPGNIGVEGCLEVEFGDAEPALALAARNLARLRVSI